LTKSFLKKNNFLENNFWHFGSYEKIIKCKKQNSTTAAGIWLPSLDFGKPDSNQNGQDPVVLLLKWSGADKFGQISATAAGHRRILAPARFQQVPSDTKIQDLRR
jgi:hypothetical protein